MSLRFERRSAPLIRLCGHGVSTSCVHSTCVFFRDYFFLPLPISLSLSLPPQTTRWHVSLFCLLPLYTRAFLERGSDDSRMNHKEGDIYTTAHAVEFTAPAGSFSSSLRDDNRADDFYRRQRGPSTIRDTPWIPLATIQIPYRQFLVRLTLLLLPVVFAPLRGDVYF